MTTVSLIVAMDENNAIGKNNDLLCYLPNDLKHFKHITQGHTVIMGRKTFESLPNGALPNRRNIVVSRTENLQLDRCEIYTSIEDALAACNTEQEVFIIGGGSIYSQSFDMADKLYITLIHHRFEDADTFFPEIKTNEWEQTDTQNCDADDKNKFAHTFLSYTRISKKRL